MRALIVEDHEPTRHLLAAALHEDGWEVVHVGTAEAAILVSPTDLDVALIDLRLGETSGLLVLGHFAGSVPCVILTQSTDGADLVEAFRIGASGYLLKSDPPPQVLAALRAVLAGELPLSAGMTHHLLAPLRTTSNPYTLVVDLTCNHAELFDPPDRRCSFRSTQAVSLLYTLGARWSLRGPSHAWMDDEAVGIAIWGRERFIEKMPGSSRLVVGKVVGV